MASAPISPAICPWPARAWCRATTAASGGGGGGGRVVASAGIGRPQKFFDSLAELGADLVAGIGFPDHHAYRTDEMAALVTQAEQAGATPVTTSKDWARLPI